MKGFLFAPEVKGESKRAGGATSKGAHRGQDIRVQEFLPQPAPIAIHRFRRHR